MSERPTAGAETKQDDADSWKRFEREQGQKWLSAVFGQIDRVVDAMPDDHPLLTSDHKEAQYDHE